jgi:acetolactate decarboxylase
MPKIIAENPNSLNLVLRDEIVRSGTDGSSVVTAALAQYPKTPVHTLFQVSTSGALVAGVYAGAVGVQGLLEHGDFGLGTFANLDGEMVVLEGHVYQVQGTGRVSEALPTARAPFAVITKFAPDLDLEIEATTNLSELQRRCDSLRTSGDIFYAVRLDGRFNRIRTRAVTPQRMPARLPVKNWLPVRKRSRVFSIFAVGGSRTHNGSGLNWKSRHISLKPTLLRNRPLLKL